MKKTKIIETINGDYRVIWQEGKYKGGYKDFNTKEAAKKYITINL
tara:strand:- start:452 stop:586 length:135 start_codon:yes stop_codon:yes gene_type:complete